MEEGLRDNMEPYFSVIMPCYNEQQFVGRAIESILNQTLGRFEFLIFDDKSSDDTASIIEAYAKIDKRIVFIRNAKNIGYAASLNKGLELMKTDIIARMDSDDISYPTRFEKQYRFLMDNPSISIVGTSARLVRRSNNEVIKDCHLKERHEDIVKHKYATSFNFHPSIMARKELFTAFGGYDTTVLRSEEYDLWLKAYDTFKFHNLPEVLLDYSVKEASDLLRWDYYKSALNIKIKHMRKKREFLKNAHVLIKSFIGYMIKKTLKRTYL